MLFLLSITRMCWNASVSLNSFLVGFTAILIGGIYGISLPVLFFYGTIVFMQLIEYIVWTHPFNSNINKYASMCAAFLLWMQPVAAILTTTYKLPLIIAYSVIGILYHIYRGWNRDEYHMYPGKDGHLVWKWLGDDSTIGLVIYFVFLFIPVFFLASKEMIIIILATLGASLYGYYTANTWGSMWCWLVNGLVILACLGFLKNLLKKPAKNLTKF